MNHYCLCGHLPKFHNMDFGRCEGLDATLFHPEDQPCTCDHYEKDSDD